MSCAPYPVAVPVANVTLADGNIMRGLSIGVGNPVQNFAFMPQCLWNNSYVYDEQGQCSNTTSQKCTTYRGGQYDQLVSTSSVQETNVRAAGGYLSDSIYTKSPAWVQDSFVLNSNETMDQFPIGIVRQDVDGPYYPQMRLGLGQNSTVLDTLYSTGQILSRTWSMFWGLTGATADQQSNGTFVFGGFDAAKVQNKDLGTNYTGTLDYGGGTTCPSGMLVTISDLTMSYPNGTRVSLFSGSRSTALKACIDPGYPVLMTMPVAYYETFESICQCENVGRSFGVNFYGMLFARNEPSFFGDLIIEIDSAIDITIPNSQLLGPEVSINDKGELRANASMNELVINSIQQINENDLPKLGRQFLSAAMVMANLDTKSFTLWQAAPSAEQSLVAVDEIGSPMTSFCSSKPGNSTSSTTSTISPTDVPSKLSKGTIAGAVVGGVVGLACLIASAILVMRYRRLRKAAHHTELELTETTYFPKDVPVNAFHEKEAAPCEVQRGGSKTKEHLPAYELPVGLASPGRAELPS